MTAKSRDPARAGSDAAAGLGEDRVGAYLLEHPDFLVRHPHVLKAMTVPSRASGDGVVDMQHFMLERLREEIGDLRDCAQDVIETSRYNMSVQTRTHAAVLALLAARDFDQLIRVISDELPLLLDVDAVTLGFERAERGAPPVAALVSPDIQRFEPGDVDRLLGRENNVVLRGDLEDDGALFGAAAGLVRSGALLRLRPGLATPPGLLALGSRAEAFHPGQGTELITFLARIVEGCVRGWLEGPA